MSLERAANAKLTENNRRAVSLSVQTKKKKEGHSTKNINIWQLFWVKGLCHPDIRIPNLPKGGCVIAKLISWDKIGY